MSKTKPPKSKKHSDKKKSTSSVVLQKTTLQDPRLKSSESVWNPGESVRDKPGPEESLRYGEILQLYLRKEGRVPLEWSEVQKCILAFQDVSAGDVHAQESWRRSRGQTSTRDSRMGGGDGDMRTKTKTGFQQTCQDKTTIRASQIIWQQKQWQNNFREMYF